MRVHTQMFQLHQCFLVTLNLKEHRSKLFCASGIVLSTYTSMLNKLLYYVTQYIWSKRQKICSDSKLPTVLLLFVNCSPKKPTTTKKLPRLKAQRGPYINTKGHLHALKFYAEVCFDQQLCVIYKENCQKFVLWSFSTIIQRAKF